MTIERRPWPCGKGYNVVTTACAFCDEPIGEHENPAFHYRAECTEAPRAIDYSHLPGGKPA